MNSESASKKQRQRSHTNHIILILHRNRATTTVEEDTSKQKEKKTHETRHWHISTTKYKFIKTTQHVKKTESLKRWGKFVPTCRALHLDVHPARQAALVKHVVARRKHIIPQRRIHSCVANRTLVGDRGRGRGGRQTDEIGVGGARI